MKRWQRRRRELARSARERIFADPAKYELTPEVKQVESGTLPPEPGESYEEAES